MSTASTSSASATELWQRTLSFAEHLVLNMFASAQCKLRGGKRYCSRRSEQVGHLIADVPAIGACQWKSGVNAFASGMAQGDQNNLITL